MASSAHDLPLFGGTKPDARTILRLNAIASLAGGALMLVLAGPLARATGIGRPGVLAIVGALLLTYGFDEFSFAVGRRLRRAHMWLFASADAAWVVAGIAFLVAGPDALGFLERALVTVAAALSGWFAVAGFRAIRSL